MSLENAQWIKDLIATNPPGGDPASQGDDHLRLLKYVLKNQFPGFTEAVGVTKTASQLNATLLPGAFGLGGFAINLTEAMWNTDNLETGFYYINGDAAATLPEYPGGFGINIDNFTNGYACQLYLTGGGTRSAWYRLKVAGTWTQYKRLWDNVNMPGQTTLIDITPAAYLTPSSFGVGGCIQAGATTNLNLAPFIGGTHNARWAGANWVNQPPGVAAGDGAVVETETLGANYHRQRFLSFTLGTEYVRWCLNGSFTGWQAVGTITLQSATPTGYQVINGMVRQWGQTAAIADDGFATVPFPVAMTECFSVVVTPIISMTGTSFSCGGVTSITGSSFTLTHMSNQATPAAFKWMAEGRL